MRWGSTAAAGPGPCCDDREFYRRIVWSMDLRTAHLRAQQKLVWDFSAPRWHYKVRSVPRCSLLLSEAETGAPEARCPLPAGVLEKARLFSSCFQLCRKARPRTWTRCRFPGSSHDKTAAGDARAKEMPPAPVALHPRDTLGGGGSHKE